MTENRRGTDKKMSTPKKPAASEAEAFPRKAIPLKSGPSADEKGRCYANLITSPELAAHRVITMMQPKNLADEIDTPTMLETLRDQAAAVQRGDMSHAEGMLINQASSLQALFVRLAERAMEQAHMPNLEGFMRMALRAQSQCRATLETLATIKNPPVVFAKQANINQGNGNQQVNNGVPATNEFPSPRTRAREEKPIHSNELLKDTSHDTKIIGMDAGTTRPASSADPQLAAVGTLNGAKHRCGQGHQQPQFT